MMQAVLWDLDGTVLDSRPGVFRSVEYAMDALRLPTPSEKELLGFLGPPIDIGFSDICHVPKPLVCEAIRLYREYYTQGGMLEADIYDGVADTLYALRSENIRSYVTTSKPHVYARRILEHFRLAPLFDGIYGAELDGFRSHKADVLQFCMERHGLIADDVVLVGDRCFDVLGAEKVGIRCIGVLYGYGVEKELLDAGAICVIDAPQDILRYI